ncbi:MAG TPA: GAF domain-containing sensor histidine kinase [Fimbriimonadaceae bacterium]|nr:GAF domain-containing sensor histidine kinase [Fimbriimonadaceae bacterium]
MIEAIGSGLELNELLTRIAEGACRLLDADNGTIGLIDPFLNRIRVAAAYRMPGDELGSLWPMGEGLMGQVWVANAPIVKGRYAEIVGNDGVDLGDFAVIGVPIRWRDRLIGVFGLGSAPPRQFGDDDIRVLEQFGAHAAIAIENARLFETTQDALAQLQILYDTSARMAMALNADDVVQAYLEQVAQLGRFACTITEYLFDERGDRCDVVVKGRWERTEGLALTNRRVGYARDSLDDLLDRGEPVLIEDVRTDQRVSETLRAMQVREGRPALALFPLMTGGVRTGLVILSATTPHAWAERDYRAILATSGHLALALERRRQQQLLGEAERQVAILEDRRRLAHELHDSVTQLLTGISLIAQAAPALWNRDPDQAEVRLGQLVDLSRRALQEMRTLLAELRTSPAEIAPPLAPPATREADALVLTLERHLASLNSDEVDLQLSAEHYVAQSSDLEHALWRIAQEAVTNALKHARATKILVALAVDEANVVLTVSDDGVGFDPTDRPEVDLERGTGLGLTGIAQRVAGLGGRSRVQSGSGLGTVVEAVLPRADQVT